jgi:putative tryptophan/tyrosine transport system substrate-binding protein
MMLKFCLIVVFFCPPATMVHAQTRVAQVGILLPDADRPQSQAVRGFKDALKELGLQERKNIVLEIRNAKGDRNGLQPAALELLAKKVDVLLTYGTRASWVAQAASRETPVVFIHPGDPAALGLVKDDSGNTTGVAGLGMQMIDKRLSFLKEIVPGVQRVLIFYDANNQYSRDNAVLAEKAARRADLQVGLNGVKALDELRATIGSLQPRRSDAIFQVPDDLVENEAAYIFDVARHKKVPTMFNEELWAINGALAAYGPSYLEMGRQAAQLVSKILQGQKARSLPIQRATKFDLTLNYRTANFIGLSWPPQLLQKADKVIR